MVKPAGREKIISRISAARNQLTTAGSPENPYSQLNTESAIESLRATSVLAQENRKIRVKPSQSLGSNYTNPHILTEKKSNCQT
jgi:hypothetical protein